MNHVLSTPALHAHLINRYDDAISSALDAANINKSRKRKRKVQENSNDTSESPEVAQFRTSLDAIQLSTWPYVPLIYFNFVAKFHQ